MKTFVNPTDSGESSSGLDPAKKRWLEELEEKKQMMLANKAKFKNTLEPKLEEFEVIRQNAIQYHNMAVDLIKEKSFDQITDPTWQKKITEYKNKLLQVAEHPNQSAVNKSNLRQLLQSIKTDLTTIPEEFKPTLDHLHLLCEILENANEQLVIGVKGYTEMQANINEGIEGCDKQLSDIQNSIDKKTGQDTQLQHVATYQRDVSGKFQRKM